MQVLAARCLFALASLATAICPGVANGASLATTRDGGAEVRWDQREIVLEVAPSSVDRSAAADLIEAISFASEVWNRALTSTGAPHLRVVPRLSTAIVQQDMHSVVLMQRRWCPPNVFDDQRCYDKHRSAITHLYPVIARQSSRDGLIDEADVEINGVDFQWSDASNMRLRAVLVHELGHVLGLEHSCGSDANGRKIAECSTASAREAAMYPDPLEPGRPTVLMPSREEISLLTQKYLRPGSRSSGCSLASRDAPASCLTNIGWFFVVAVMFLRRRCG